jgi:hypothetical protein
LCFRELFYGFTICFLKERQSYYIALTKIALLFLRMKFMEKQVVGGFRSMEHGAWGTGQK